MKKSSLSLLALLIITSCALKPEPIPFSWVGSNINEAVKNIGAPSSIKTVGGKKLYFYTPNRRNKPYSITATEDASGNITATTLSVSGGLIQQNCTTIYEVENDIITASRRYGNNCPFAALVKNAED